jgi:hypothetical protein
MTNEWIDGWMNGLIDGWIDGWMDDEWIDALTFQGSLHVSVQVQLVLVYAKILADDVVFHSVP